MGRRRSARTQGLPPPSPSNTPQIDFLTEKNVTIRTNDTSPSSHRSATNADDERSYNNNFSDDLLSFTDYNYDFSSNDNNSSDNLLSLASSQPSETPQPITKTVPNSKNNNTNDAIIEQLQHTITLLHQRLGLLESTNNVNLNPPTPTKPSPPMTPQNPSAPIQHIESNKSGVIKSQQPIRQQIDPPDMDYVIKPPSLKSTSGQKTIPSQDNTTNVKAPDPPEEYFDRFPTSAAIPAIAVATVTSHSISSSKQSQATPAPISQPTQSFHDIFSPPPPVALPPPTPAVVYSKDTKLSFTVYKSSSDYSHWKALCLLEACNNTKYHNIARKINGKFHFNNEMSDDDSTALYLATMKSLGSNAYNIISIEDTERADGIQLWKELDEYFNEKEDSILLKHDIKKNFESLTRQSNETIDNYRVKFEKHLYLMRINSISIPSHLELVYQFLNNMKVIKVFDDIKMKIDTEDSFFRNLSWKQLCTKSKKQIRLYMKIHPGTDVLQQEKKREPKQPKPKPTYPQKERDRNENLDYKTTLDLDKLNQIKSLLKRANNPKYELHNLYTKHEFTCPIHSDTMHPLLGCTLLSSSVF